MSASRKQLPSPAAAPDLTALLRSRHVQTEDDQEATHARGQSQPPLRSTDDVAQSLVDTLDDRQPADALIDQVVGKPKVSRAKRPAGPEMDRRSWYMPKETADALAAAVEELHWQTRQPKHVVLTELIGVALQHQAEAARRLQPPR